VPFCVRAIAVIVFGASVSLACTLCAQPNQPLRGNGDLLAEGRSAQVREVGPPYYVKDENGQLVPVLNLTLAELQRLLQRDSKPTDPHPQLPQFTLQSLQDTGNCWWVPVFTSPWTRRSVC
jgi:hypothetical protein